MRKKMFFSSNPFLKKGGEGTKTCYLGKALAEIPFLLVIIKPLTLSGTHFFYPKRKCVFSPIHYTC